MAIPTGARGCKDFGNYPITGELSFVRYEPGKAADCHPAEIARLWAETARIYD